MDIRKCYKNRKIAEPKNYSEAQISNSAKIYPNYYEISKNFDYNTKYECVINDDRAFNKPISQKIVTMLPSNDIFIGDYIHWKRNNDTWLTISEDRQYDFQQKGHIQKCNNALKWKDEFGLSHEVPCVIDTASKYLEGFSEDKKMKVIDSQYYVLIQYNTETSKLPLNFRFIISGKAFEITKIGDFAHVTKTEGETPYENPHGVIQLILDEVEVINGKDDLINNIAWNGSTEAIYTLEINENNIQLSALDTVQISSTVKKDGIIVSEPVEYESINTAIATVNESGLITAVADGNTTVTVKLASNLDIYKTINITVTNTIIDNFKIDISGDQEIYLDTINTYEIVEYNNGEPVVETFNVSIVNGSNLVDLTVLDNDTFALTALDYGSVIIQVEDSQSRTQNITIEVVSLFG